MKFLSILSLSLMLVMTVACGGKDKGSSNSGVFSNNISTQEGYYVPSTGALEVGSQVYPANMIYKQVMDMAIQQAQMANVQQVNVNGVLKFRARITASINNGTYTGTVNNGVYPGVPNYPSSGAVLNLTSVQLY